MNTGYPNNDSGKENPAYACYHTGGRENNDCALRTNQVDRQIPAGKL